MRHDIDALPDVIYLGRVGQNDAIKIDFDVTAWLEAYPAGTITMYAKRPTEDTEYTVAAFATLLKGAYSAGTAYAVGDEVTYDSDTYSCIQAGTGHTPDDADSEYWELVGDGTRYTYRWIVDDIDNGIEGMGEAQINITLTGTIYNSVVFKTLIEHGLTGGGVLTAIPTLTTRGDLLTRNATTYSRIAIGTNGQVLTSNGTDASWATPTAYEASGTVATHNAAAAAHNLNSAAVVGALPMPDAGSYFTTDTITGQMQQNGLYSPKNVLTTEGDIIYRNATVPTRLAKGTAAQALCMNSGATAPEWKTLDSSPATILTTEGDIMYRNATVPARLAKGTAYQHLQMNSGATAPEWATWTLTGSDTWNPGSLADGAGETSAAFTVTGAALGDTVLAGAPYDLQGITCTAYVSAANTVKIRLQNETGGTIDLASGTWKVRVFKQ